MPLEGPNRNVNSSPEQHNIAFIILEFWGQINYNVGPKRLDLSTCVCGISVILHKYVLRICFILNPIFSLSHFSGRHDSTWRPHRCKHSTQKVISKEWYGNSTLMKAWLVTFHFKVRDQYILFPDCSLSYFMIPFRYISNKT